MSALESLVLAYLLNSLWQIPVIVAAAWLAAHLVRPAGLAAEHRVWVGALLGETFLPAFSLLPWEQLHIAWPWRMHAAESSAGSVIVQLGAGVSSSVLHIPTAFLATLTLGYAVATTYLAARFAWRWWRLRELAFGAEPVELSGDAELLWTLWSKRFDAGRVALFSSKGVFAPLAMGIAKGCVMLPAGMIGRLPAAELDAVIGHELAHVRRQDFLKNLLYEFLTLPVSYHPGVWFTRQRMMESREMICDEMAAALTGGQEYAESLLRVAGLLLRSNGVRVPYAIGVFDSSTLERRLMKLMEKRERIGRVRLWASLAACVVLGVVTATSAVALRVGVDQKASGEKEALSKSIPSSVPAKVMQERIITKVPPVYPPEAKKARIQGKVVLEAVIGKTGHVENLRVVSGPGALQQSAMDAVRQWVYKPVLLNGNPVGVKTTINVIYTLAK